MSDMSSLHSTIRTAFLLACSCSMLWMCTKDKEAPKGVSSRVRVTTTNITGLTADSALSGGVIAYDGGDSVLERGVCWGLVDTPSAAGPDRTVDGGGKGTFSSRVKPLKPNTSYFLRAYAKSRQGFIYGNAVAFKTPSRPPTVVTNDPTGITITSATLAGTVASDGGSAVTQRGFYWSATNTAPTQADNILNAGNGTGAFNATLSGLLGGRTHYVRAWATNSVGTAVASNVVTFTTQPPKVPVMGALSTGTVTRVSADALSAVASNEGAPVTDYGFCWSTSPSPTYLLPTRRNFTGNPTGNFSSNLTGLAAGTTYYIRAYAVNAVGVGYSTQQAFQTSPVVPPTLTMTSATGTGMTTASVAGNVSDDGGSTIVARGFMVGLTSPPSGPMIPVGAGIGSFSQTIGSLTPGRTYFARAYATNALGTTALSPNILSFTTTPASPPVVTTNAPSSVTASSFIGGGNVLSDGGAPITERGLVYGTSPNPDVNTGVRVLSGTGLGIFSGSLSGLASNTTYYVRAYATNGSATGYGAQQVVLTLLATPSLQSPANGVPVGCCYPTFTWGVVAGATLYEIQIARNTGFTGTAAALSQCPGGWPNVSFVNVGTTNTNSFCINTGTSGNNGTWYWRVRARNASNTSDWSTIRMYTYTF